MYSVSLLPGPGWGLVSEGFLSKACSSLSVLPSPTGPLPFEGITVTMDSRQMNGTHRVVFDRVLTESECKDLLRLTKVRPGCCRSCHLCPSLLSRQDYNVAVRRKGNLTCVLCIVLLQAAAGTGDGYRARRSPHTPHERFEGLTVLKATQVSGSWLSIKHVYHPSVFLFEVLSGQDHGCVIFLTRKRAASPDLPHSR